MRPSYGITTDADGNPIIREIPISWVSSLPASGDFPGHIFYLTAGTVGLYYWDGTSFIGPLGTGGGGGGAPVGAQYLVGALDGTLTAERLVTDTPTGAWDLATPGQAKVAVPDNAITNAKAADMADGTLKGRALGAGAGDPTDLTPAQGRTILNVADGANAYVHPNHSGDVTSAGDGAQTIAPGVVTSAKLANMATNTVKGRIAAGTGVPTDLPLSAVKAANSVVRTDSFGKIDVDFIDNSSPGLTPALLVNNSSGAMAWALANVGDQVFIGKALGTNIVGVRFSHTAMTGTPREGQWLWRSDLQTWFVYNATLAGWLSSEVYSFDFSMAIDWSTTGYLTWGMSGDGAPQFKNRLGPMYPFQTIVCGMSLSMDAVGTASVQVTGGGSAVGGTGDTLALSAIIKDSQWGVYSSAIAAETVLGVKLISGTLEGPCAGTVYLRRFET